MYARIGELAEQGGFNITGLLAKRDELRAEYDIAQQQNDHARMARSEALRATLIRLALENLSQ